MIDNQDRKAKAMDRSRRVVVHLLLVSMWAVSLLALAYPARAQAQAGGGGIHVVDAGETLRDIARQEGTDVATLIAINDLPNGDLIYVGEQLILPGGSPNGGGWEQPSQQNTNTQNGQSDNNASGMAWHPRRTQDDSYPSGQDNQRQGVAYDPSASQQGDSGGPQGPYGADPNWGDAAGNSQQTPGNSYAPVSDNSPQSDQGGPNQGNDDWTWVNSQVNSEDNSYVQGSSWDPSAAGQGNGPQGVAYDPSASQQSDNGGGPQGSYGVDPNWGAPDGNSQQTPGNSYAPDNGSSPQSAQGGANQQDSDWAWAHSDDNANSAGSSWEPVPNVAQNSDVAPAGEKWIDIDISDQTLTAYQGDGVVRGFIISTGSAYYPTVTGTYYTYARFDLQDMSGGSVAAGDYYYQPDVPWVQYFFEGFSIHGAYWHNMFGTPIGHGCINMRVDEAKWLYDCTGVTGIRVVVHQ